MSAGMNVEEARVIANKMRFVDAVYNALHAKCVPYRKATKIKLNELLDIAKDVDEAKSKGCDEVELSLYYNGWNEGYNKAIGNISNSLDELEKKYVEQYGCEIVEMYADVVRELKQLLN